MLVNKHLMHYLKHRGTTIIFKIYLATTEVKDTHNSIKMSALRSVKN